MADFVAAVMQWTSIEWVAGQIGCGNTAPFLTWTLFAFVVGVCIGVICERRNLNRVSKRKIARGFSAEVKAAAIAAIEAEGAIELGVYWESVIGFSREYPHVFTFSYDLEDVREHDTFQLSAEWRSYLTRHKRYLR